MSSFLRTAAGWVSSSFLLSKGCELFGLNSREWTLPLSKWQKLMTGSYIILKDYSEGRFPPIFDDRAKAWQAEMDYNESLPGISFAEHQQSHMRKPFWGPEVFRKYSLDFVRLLRVFEQIGLKPGSRLLVARK